MRLPIPLLLIGILPVAVTAQTVKIPRSLAVPSSLNWQTPAQTASSERKYKLTVVEDASKFRRAKKGRASSEAVVRVTDENDIPVAGIVVTFSIPQLVGASFTSGALTVTGTTTGAGLATAGLSVTTATTTNFSIAVAASVQGTALSASIPVNAAAAAAAAGGGSGAAAAAAGAGGGGGGMSGTTIGIIVAAVAGGAAAGIGVALGGGKKPDPQPPPPTQPGVRIGIGGISVFPGQ